MNEETPRCRECEGLYLVPPSCDYIVGFYKPDCLNCPIDNEKSRRKKRDYQIFRKALVLSVETVIQAKPIGWQAKREVVESHIA